jgi:hypothetical protein
VRALAMLPLPHEKQQSIYPVHVLHTCLSGAGRSDLLELEDYDGSYGPAQVQCCYYCCY